MKYQIRYGLGGGFGGPGDWETIDAQSLEEAHYIAYEYACDEYEQYVGMYGLRTIEEIMIDEGMSESEAEADFKDERETWLEWEAREVI